MNKQAIKDFNKAINALALELPEHVWNDFHFRWVQFQNAKPSHPEQGEQGELYRWITFVE